MSRTKHHGKRFRLSLKWGHFEAKREKKLGRKARWQLLEESKLRAERW